MSEIKMVVVKRDGSRVAYDNEKIQNAVAKALVATGEVSTNRISMTAQVVGTLVEFALFDDARQAATGEISVSIEEIQDLVETTLMEQGLPQTAKAYILYRQNHQKMRETQSAILDVKKTIEGYVGPHKDWRVKENATVSLSLGGLILSNSGAITAHYWLSEIYDREISAAHKAADMHIHDLSMLSGYCAGWSLRQLIVEGLGGVEGRITSSPAAHLSTLCNQMVNFLGIMQNEWAGAQAFSSFDTYLAPFVKVDNLSQKEVKQCIQSFVYGVNTPSRWGTQPPFTNITLDWKVPEDMRDLPAIVRGEELDFTYGDCQKEVDMINKAFIEIMIEGDANGRGFQYPIPTYSITRDFDWSETENNKLLFEMTAKYGTPYFSNYINSDMQPSDVRSMCCRLRLDLRELRKKSGGFFGSGESTGSIGVVTLNLPRMAYLSETEAEFYDKLDALMDIAARSLDTKRKVIARLMSEGLYPYTARYLGAKFAKTPSKKGQGKILTPLYKLLNIRPSAAQFDFETCMQILGNHFSTIGLVGMNEAARNAKWLRTDLTTPEGQDFAKAVLNHMRERLSDFQEKYGALFNLEATPAESTTYRFAKHDKEEFPNIITAAKEGAAPFYTNSSHIPVGYTDDIFEALDLQDELQTLYTSGTVFHAFLGERLPSWKAAATLVRKIAENYHLPYYTISPTYSVCPEHGYIPGEHHCCPQCGEATEIYSRITGYYRPVKNWNDGKAEEFKERKLYDVEAEAAGEIVMEKKPQTDNPKVPPAPMCSAPSRASLVATKTCPNCKIAESMLDEAGIHYDVLYAEEDPDRVKAWGILSAPTLVIPSEPEGGEAPELYVGAGAIRNYIMKKEVK